MDVVLFSLGSQRVSYRNLDKGDHANHQGSVIHQTGEIFCHCSNNIAGDYFLFVDIALTFYSSKTGVEVVD